MTGIGQFLPSETIRSLQFAFIVAAIAWIAAIVLSWVAAEIYGPNAGLGVFTVWLVVVLALQSTLS